MPRRYLLKSRSPADLMFAVPAHHNLVLDDAAVFSGNNARIRQRRKRNQNSLRRIRGTDRDGLPLEIRQARDVCVLGGLPAYPTATSQRSCYAP